MESISAEMKLEIDHLKDVLFEEISHDVKNPIIGSLYIIENMYVQNNVDYHKMPV